MANNEQRQTWPSPPNAESINKELRQVKECLEVIGPSERIWGRLHELSEEQKVAIYRLVKHSGKLYALLETRGIGNA